MRVHGDAVRARVASTIDIGREMAREWSADRVTGLAAEVAFFAILGLFPALLAMTAALGSMQSLVGEDLVVDAEDAVIGFLQDVLTDEASDLIDSVEGLFQQGAPGAATVGAVAAVWAASRGFLAVINALDVVYDLEERRGYLRQRALALGLAFGSLVMVALMLAMLVVGPLLGTGRDVADAVGLGDGFATFWDWFRLPAAFAALVAWAATLFHIAPYHRTPWRADVPGAVLTTLAWVAVSFGFRIYVGLAGSANQVLGVLGGSLIVLLWFYLLAIGLVLGGELNAVLEARRARAAGAGAADAGDTGDTGDTGPADAAAATGPSL